MRTERALTTLRKPGISFLLGATVVTAPWLTQASKTVSSEEVKHSLFVSTVFI